MHSPNRWINACILLVLMSVIVTSAGAQAVGAFSPVPIWPADGNIPAELADPYVFYSPATEEIVLSIPENLLQEPDLFGKLPDGPPGSRKVFRIRTTRGSRPTLDVTVSRLSGGSYQYIYRLANGANALRAITSWQLYTNWIADTGVVAAPNQWRGSFTPTQVSLGAKPAAGPYGAFTLNSGMFVDWVYDDDKAPIAREPR
jgi:hypothetical protein